MVIFPKDVTQWQISMVFDKSLTEFYFYKGIIVSSDDESKSFLIQNESWNSVQFSGSNITSIWLARFNPTPIPHKVISAQLVGFECN